MSSWPKVGLIPHDHTHALGEIAIRYNYIEETIAGIIGEYLPDLSADSFLHHLHNTARLDLLRELARTDKDPKMGEHLLHAIQCVDICIENRNILLHAVFMHHGWPGGDVTAVKRKSGGSSKINFDLSLDLLRRTADEMGDTLDYLTQLSLFLMNRRPRIVIRAAVDPLTSFLDPLRGTTWLRKPPQPNKLNSRQPGKDRRDAPPLPRSSPASRRKAAIAKRKK
ncbi:hypothetical protein [Reyranella sp.]|uniref:hypothetical protein n=1 Tax=Reyranella sp. TaxID=1929291 RepID=UPI002730EB80|nr:hypothetical protein [Reyranella sp.]MDP2376139.1 hypothetical protein [Reyranella sp.]